MNRKELQEWLDQFPEDTIINVAMTKSIDRCGRGKVFFEEFVAKDARMNPQYAYRDFEGCRLVKPDSPNYNKKYLWLGDDGQ